MAFRRQNTPGRFGLPPEQLSPRADDAPAQAHEPPAPEPIPQTPPDDAASANPQGATQYDTLHLGLDVRFWNMSGIGTFQRELLIALARLGLPLSLTCVGPESVREELPPALRIERWIDYRVPVYSPRNLMGYPRPGPVDVFHYPHYNAPLLRARGLLVNVFDLFHLKYGNFPRRACQRFFLQRLRWAGRNALVVTASDSVSRELQQAGLKTPRLRRVFPGPGRSLPPERPPRAEVRSLAGQPLRGPWLLATGIDQPHKNFDFLLSALSLYYQRRPDAPPLVWTGLSAEAIQRRARQLTVHTRQRLALEEFSSRERIEGLLAGATALVFPSLDEGFGFPPLEAMSRGIPVLCARREPMTRHLGAAPLWFEPAESSSLWRMLDRLLDNPNLRREQIALGFKAAGFFNWDRTAHQYYALYHELARGH